MSLSDSSYFVRAETYTGPPKRVGDIVVSRTRPNPNHRHLRPWILFLPVGGTLAAFQYMSGRHK